jgi:hypothetical protein
VFISTYVLCPFHSLSSSSKFVSPTMFYFPITLFLLFYLRVSFAHVCLFMYIFPSIMLYQYFLSFSSSLFLSSSFPFLFHFHTQFLSLLRKFSLFLFQCFLTTKSHLHQTVSHFVSLSLASLLISVRLTANSLLPKYSSSVCLQIVLIITEMYFRETMLYILI